MFSLVPSVLALLQRADFGPVRRSFCLCGRFFPMVVALGLAAGIGRGLQLGAAGELSRPANLAIEFVIEGGRCTLLLYLMGRGSLAAGWSILRRILTRQAWNELGPVLRSGWRGLAVNLAVFALLAAVANVAVFAVARNWTALAMLQHCGWVAEQAGVWVTILFLKNLSVIPWTLAFIAALGHWLDSTRARPA